VSSVQRARGKRKKGRASVSVSASVRVRVSVSVSKSLAVAVVISDNWCLRCKERGGRGRKDEQRYLRVFVCVEGGLGTLGGFCINKGS